MVHRQIDDGVGCQRTVFRREVTNGLLSVLRQKIQSGSRRRHPFPISAVHHNRIYLVATQQIIRIRVIVFPRYLDASDPEIVVEDVFRIVDVYGVFVVKFSF